jgi:aconitate hydratase
MTSLNIAQKLLKAHLVEGSLRAGTPITLKIEQTLTQDATGTLVMLALEAMDSTALRRKSVSSMSTTTSYRPII